MGRAEQIAVRSMADQMKTASNSLAQAAVNGAEINSRLSAMAVKRLDALGDDTTPEDLKPIAALVATGNEAAKPALELVKASRSIQREEADDPAVSLRDVGRMTDEELRAIVARGRLNG